MMFVVYVGLVSDGLWFVRSLFKVYLRLAYGFFNGGLECA